MLICCQQAEKGDREYGNLLKEEQEINADAQIIHLLFAAYNPMWKNKRAISCKCLHAHIN